MPFIMFARISPLLKIPPKQTGLYGSCIQSKRRLAATTTGGDAAKDEKAQYSCY